jgi:hypothetical protein
MTYNQANEVIKLLGDIRECLKSPIAVHVHNPITPLVAEDIIEALNNASDRNVKIDGGH